MFDCFKLKQLQTRKKENWQNIKTTFIVTLSHQEKPSILEHLRGNHCYQSTNVNVNVIETTKNAVGELQILLKDDNIAAPPEETPIPPKSTQVMWCDHKRLSDTDANLVDGNVSISAAFGWNTSINFILTPGSGQSAYITSGIIWENLLIRLLQYFHWFTLLGRNN